MRSSTLFSVCLVITGCVSGRFGPRSTTLATDKSLYDAEVTGHVYNSSVFGMKVVARFENRSDRVVYLQRCSPSAPEPMYMVASANGSSSADSYPAYAQAWACVGHDNHIAVQPRSTRIDTVMLRGPNAFDGVTHKPVGVTEGRFRLEYAVLACQQDDCGRERVKSNAFTVRTPTSASSR